MISLNIWCGIVTGSININISDVKIWLELYFIQLMEKKPAI